MGLLAWLQNRRETWAIAKALSSAAKTAQLLPMVMNGEQSPLLADGTHIQGYSLNAWVYACVNRIGHAVAEAPMIIEQRKGSGKAQEWEEAEGHPLAELLDYVNADEDGYQLRLQTASWLALHGNAYWLLLRGTGSLPAALQVLPPNSVTVVAGRGKRSGQVEGYKVRSSSGTETTFADDEVVHFKLFGARDQLYGQSPLKAIETEINTYTASGRFNSAYFRNGAVPSIIFKALATLSADQRQRMSEAVREWQRYGGTRPLLLDGDLEAIVQGANIDAGTATALPKLLRETIAAAFGVPPAMIGLLEYASYANANQQAREFYGSTVTQYWRLIESAVNEQLTYLYGDQYRTRFETTGIAAMQTNFVEVAASLQSLQAHMTTDEIREHLLDLPPLGGDWGGAKWGSFSETVLARPGEDVLAREAEKPIEQAPSGPEPEPSEDAAETAPPEEQPAKAASRWIRKGTQRRLSREARAKWLQQFQRSRRANIALLKRLQGPWYDDLREEVLGNLEAQAKGLLPGRIKDPPLRTLLYDTDEATKQLRLKLDPAIKGIYQQAGEAAIASASSGISFALDNPAARAYLRGRSVQMKSVVESAQTRLRDALAEGMANGETVEELRQRVLQWAEEGKEQYAETVARTETGSSMNQASLDGYTQGGATHKEWLSGGGPNARDWHSAMDGTVIPIDGLFELETGSFNGPGDPAMGVEDVANCGCTLAPAFEDEE